MAIPNLTLAPGRTNYSSAIDVPDNGNNTFQHGWNLDPNKITTDQIKIKVVCLGLSVTAAAFVGLSADGLSLTVNFTQAGADQCLVVAEHVHSVAQ